MELLGGFDGRARTISQLPKKIAVKFFSASGILGFWDSVIHIDFAISG
jgi:hypothetical protein